MKKFSTDRQVAALSPLQGQKQTEYYHSKESGLIVRVGAVKKSWVVKYTLNGKRKKYTLPGGYPETTLAEAKEECQRIKANATKGVDPLGKRTSHRDAVTIADVMDHYFKETSMAESTRKESCRISNKDITPMLGEIKAVDLQRRDVKMLHSSIVNRGSAVAANRTVELMRRAFNCAHEEELIDTNPFPNLKKIKTKESSRDRTLKNAEIKTLWKALDQETDNMRDIIRLLLLLGQRSMETMSMEVADIDQDRKEWTVPASRTKTGKSNVVPLPPTAWEIIKPRLSNSKWVFPSAYNTTRNGAKGDGHAKSTKDVRRRLQKSTCITDWTAHDLRRTCRTLMSREGVLPHIAEQVLGHAQGNIEGIYDQHAYLNEKQIALGKVDWAICKILGINTGTAVVIPLRRQA